MRGLDTIHRTMDGKYNRMGQPDEGFWKGTWKRREVSFSRKYRGHKLTDEECQKLCKGERVRLFGLLGLHGTTYDADVWLEERHARNLSYVTLCSELAVEKEDYENTDEKQAAGHVAASEMSDSLAYDSTYLDLPYLKQVSDFSDKKETDTELREVKRDSIEEQKRAEEALEKAAEMEIRMASVMYQENDDDGYEDDGDDIDDMEIDDVPDELVAKAGFASELDVPYVSEADDVLLS